MKTHPIVSELLFLKNLIARLCKKLPTGIPTQGDYLGTTFLGDKMRLKIRGGSAVLNNDIHLCILLFFAGKNRPPCFRVRKSGKGSNYLGG